MPRSIAVAGLAPFGVRSAMAFDPGPPPALGSDAAAREIAEVRAARRRGQQRAQRRPDRGRAVLELGETVRLRVAGSRPRSRRSKLDALDVARIARARRHDRHRRRRSSARRSRSATLHWRPESAIAGPFARRDRDTGLAAAGARAEQPAVPVGRRRPAPASLEVELPRLFGVDRRRRVAQQPDRPDAALAERGGAGRRAGARRASGPACTSAAPSMPDAASAARSPREILDRQLLPR